ncbi:Energy transducer TonB [Candidatus Hepatincolaceae symbiont of Richtersius coronifer]
MLTGNLKAFNFKLNLFNFSTLKQPIMLSLVIHLLLIAIIWLGTLLYKQASNFTENNYTNEQSSYDASSDNAEAKLNPLPVNSSSFNLPVKTTKGAVINIQFTPTQTLPTATDLTKTTLPIDTLEPAIVTKEHPQSVALSEKSFITSSATEIVEKAKKKAALPVDHIYEGNPTINEATPNESAPNEAAANVANSSNNPANSTTHINSGNILHPTIDYHDLEGTSDNSLPFYPLIARTNRWEGQVIIKATVDEKGKIIEVLVEKSSGYTVLDNSAIKAIKSWRIKPKSTPKSTALQQITEPQKITVIIPINFKIKS